MCGRFSLGATIRVAQLFDLPNWPETPRRYNIAPSQQVPAVIQNRETGAREFRPFRWGLIPSWAKDPAVGYRTINARSESAAGERKTGWNSNADGGCRRERLSRREAAARGDQPRRRRLTEAPGSANRSAIGTPRAVAMRSMLINATFRSPRSMPPMYVW